MAIVVDPPDESDTLENPRLIIHLLTLAGQIKSIRLKFFIASRPELPIRLGFEDVSGKYDGLVLHEVPYTPYYS
jgi:hypothetical protein